MTIARIASLLVCSALTTPARAFADLNFDATSVTPDAGFDALPAGWYNAHIDESEKKPTAVKPGETESTGWYLKLRFHIIDGQYAGRKVYTNLNLGNTGPNGPQTVEIAQKQLSAICHAVNVLKPAKSEQLHGIPMKIKLKFKPATAQYSEGNEIQSYKPITEKVDMAGGDAGAAAFGAGTTALTPPPAADAGAQPWATGAAAAVAGEAPATEAPQPWAQPGAADTAAAPAPAPAAPTPEAPPAVPAAPAPAPVHDPLEAATKDGWIQHPASPPHLYKGQEVKTKEEVAGMYPAPAPVVPAAPDPTPAAPAVPAAPAANAASGDPAAAQGASPPWVNK